MDKFRDEGTRTGRKQTVNFPLRMPGCVCVCVCLHWMVGCFYLPLIERIKKIKIKKERKATIPMLLPNVFLNASDPTFNFKLFKSISLMGPNLVLTCLGQLKSAGSVAP